MPGSVKALVLDSGPLIKGAKPEAISGDVYTIREVVSEIRDAATRQRLSVLPYELKFREPTPASIRFGKGNGAICCPELFSTQLQIRTKF